VRFLDWHLERLVTGCERLKINLRDVDPLRLELRQAAAAAGEGLIKVIVTRGEAVARGYGISGTEVATRLVFRYPLPPDNGVAAREGIQARVARMRYGENELLAGMKHLNRLEQVLARSEVPAGDAAELLVFGSSGQLVSGTMSNVFLVQGGRLRTPRIDRCGVAGVMRRVVLHHAALAGLSAEECTLTPDDLAEASEVFVTNARIGIWPVSTLDGRALNVGAVTRRLQALLAPMLENPVDAPGHAQ
jgi:4-amino-4-deoxychorismate lyase